MRRSRGPAALGCGSVFRPACARAGLGPRLAAGSARCGESLRPPPAAEKGEVPGWGGGEAAGLAGQASSGAARAGGPRGAEEVSRAAADGDAEDERR